MAATGHHSRTSPSAAPPPQICIRIISSTFTHLNLADHHCTMPQLHHSRTSCRREWHLHFLTAPAVPQAWQPHPAIIFSLAN
ncbi:hypothetical protein DEO72_LG7g1616 [Vigna unguiculata]|uniref:Uncharacterized protein n=1 Tax=Vigna unguiculata TaxID=3917 RepID=A0A4D6MG23_VIGUN|nr:hypothetical protein DEO72_LG7g1616 [Vigna unguiculata]